MSWMFGEENNLIYHLPFHPALNEIVTRLETTSQHTILSYWWEPENSSLTSQFTLLSWKSGYSSVSWCLPQVNLDTQLR